MSRVDHRLRVFGRSSSARIFACVHRARSSSARSSCAIIVCVHTHMIIRRQLFAVLFDRVTIVVRLNASTTIDA